MGFEEAEAAAVLAGVRDGESAVLSVDVCARLHMRRLDGVRRLVALAVPSLLAVGEARTLRLASERAARSQAACACLRRLLGGEGGGGRPPLGLAEALSAWRTVSRQRRAEREQEALRLERARARAASFTGQGQARRREQIVAALREAASEAQAVLASIR